MLKSALLGLAATALQATNARCQEVILTEVSTFPIEGARRPLANVVNQACLLIWDREVDGPFLKWCPDKVDTVGSYSRGILAAGWQDSVVTAIDSAWNVVKLGRQRNPHRRPLTAITKPIGIAITGDRWFVLDSPDAANAYLVSGLDTVPTDTLGRFALGNLAIGAHSFHIAVYAEEVVVTMSYPPFASYVIRRSTKTVGLLRTARASDENLKRGDFDGWISLPVIKLSESYLQVLTDLRSDRRIIIRYDSAGNELSLRFMEAPFGLQLSAWPIKVVYGSRDLGSRVEFVRYQWR